jgi:hypothetical protein
MTGKPLSQATTVFAANPSENVFAGLSPSNCAIRLCRDRLEPAGRKILVLIPSTPTQVRIWAPARGVALV